MKQCVDLRHFPVETIEGFGDLSIGGQGRGIFPRTTATRLQKAESDREVRSQELTPAAAIAYFHEQSGLGSALEKLARPRHAQSQQRGNGLRPEQGAKAGQREEPGQGARAILVRDGSLRDAILALGVVETFKPRQRAGLKRAQGRKPICLIAGAA